MVYNTRGEVFLNQSHLIEHVISLSPFVLPRNHPVKCQAKYRHSNGHQKEPKRTRLTCLSKKWIAVDALGGEGELQEGGGEREETLNRVEHPNE